MLHDTATLITRRNTMLTLGGMTALVLALSVGSAEAGTTELRNTISANAALQHLYSFEGATDAERRADGEGSVDLSNVVGSTGGNVANIAYLPGFDGNATVYRPEYTGNATEGAGLQSTSNVSWADTLTVETIVRADGAGGNQYIVAGPGTTDGGRGYWLYTQPTKFRTAVSNTGGLNDASSDIANFTPGHWYYVASTYTKDGGGNVTINSYIADLSNHETTLTHAVVNDTRANPFGSSSKIGVGMFSGGPQEFFDGQLDEVAVYNNTLSQSTLQSHLDSYFTFTATSGDVFEDFDNAAENGLHPALEDRAGSYTFSSDEAENTGGRDFIRTRATNYNEINFKAEVTYTLTETDGQNIPFFGLGDGKPDPTEFSNPAPAFYLEGLNLRIEEDAGEGIPDSVVQLFSSPPGTGTHRLRIIKIDDDVTFALDADYAGGPFVSDESYTLSLSTIAPFLDNTNSRIFFGSQSDDNATVFDDFSLTVIPEPTGLAMLLAGLPALMRRRRA